MIGDLNQRVLRTRTSTNERPREGSLDGSSGRENDGEEESRQATAYVYIMSKTSLIWTEMARFWSFLRVFEVCLVQISCHIREHLLVQSTSYKRKFVVC